MPSILYVFGKKMCYLSTTKTSGDLGSTTRSDKSILSQAV